MTIRIIGSEEDLAEAAVCLADAVPRFALALEAIGPLRLRRRDEGFATLFSAIVSQQVSTASADAVWARVEQLGATEAHLVTTCADSDLRDCGLSRQKIAYARALAASCIDFTALRDLPDAEVISELTRVKGIGVWTAQIYAMFSLGRADIFASGDLALQESAARLFGLSERPREKALREMSESWSPWRSAASHILWAYYRVETGKEGVR